ncbi:MAG TPA: hypothetical protein VNO33_01650 [Kofleriaceae bacterium]|nr:hypothetical protein [Kofleriaceae bacterium]
MDRDELAERVGIIETMIADGRRDTEYWGWAFVLWGVGHLIAAFWGQAHAIAWPATMTACGVVMAVGAVRRSRRRGKTTTLGRALGALWTAIGIAMFVAMVGGIASDLAGGTVVTLFFLLMGTATFASGVIVRWPWWSGLGVLWWAVAVASMVAPPDVTFWLFVGMALVGEVAFGAYMMVLERRDEDHAEATGP